MHLLPDLSVKPMQLTCTSFSPQYWQPQDSLILGISLLTASHQRHITYHSWTSSNTKATTCQPRAIWRSEFQETTALEMWSSSSLSQPRTEGPGPSHMSVCPWVHLCDRQQWQCYCTIIKSSKGAACIIPLLSNIRSLVYSISESVAPTPCEFCKILSCKHFCHIQSRSGGLTDPAVPTAGTNPSHNRQILVPQPEHS